MKSVGKVLARPKIYFDKIFVFQDWLSSCMKWAAISTQIECDLVNVLRLSAIALKNARRLSEIVLQSTITSESMQFYQLDQDHHMNCESKFDHEASDSLLSSSRCHKIVAFGAEMSWVLLSIILLLTRLVVINISWFAVECLWRWRHHAEWTRWCVTSMPGR